ncbi:hypothetical protein [Streptomyces sp. NPDC094032]|uniref:hypothetical protein n=1 Tax=Streptomyces sp. NPDC094032 TaxID=3155308 RepID=UPI00331B0687
MKIFVRRPGVVTALAGLMLITAAAPVAATTSASTSSQAAAVTVDALCPTGATTVNYSPGATLTPRQTNLSFSGSAAPCTSTTDPNISAISSFSGTGQGELGCTTGSFDATGTIIWNTGAMSQVTFSSQVDLRPDGIPVIVATGPVTSGKFSGSTVALTVELLPANPLACLTPTGVTQTHGPSTITISHL